MLRDYRRVMWGVYVRYVYMRDITPKVRNQGDKQMEHETESGSCRALKVGVSKSHLESQGTLEVGSCHAGHSWSHYMVPSA